MGPRDWRLASVSSASRRRAWSAGIELVERLAGFDARQHVLGGGIREEQVALRADDRDRVLEVLERPTRGWRPARHLRTIGRELRADGVEERAELAELLVLLQVEPHAELAAAEPGQAAADDVNRPEQQLREGHRPEHRDAQREERRPDRVAEASGQVVADEQRRHADADRAEFGVAEQQRLPQLEVFPSVL